MVNKLRMIQWPLMAIIFALFLGAIIYSIEKEQHQCNQVVFLDGELSRDINYVDYLNHGNIARIHYCDGNVEDIPTIRIIKVVIK
jgi:hypothetical protein